MVASRFRKKPVVISAIRWDGTHECYKELYDFCKGADGVSVVLGPHPDESVHIRTLEGLMIASKGDWVIRGVKGEFYPCKPDIFDATYEELI